MSTRLTPALSERDHVLGPADAPVTLVEYGDYECPYCRMAHPIVKSILRQMGDTVRFAYRHFPLTRAHPHAESAAQMVECPSRRGDQHIDPLTQPAQLALDGLAAIDG
jgi:protein-disulfide isomerase